MAAPIGVLNQLMNELNLIQNRSVYKHTTPTGAPGAATPYLTGPGGMFGVSGLERDVISSRMQPEGLASDLEVRLTTKMNPLYPYITGFKGAVGTQPTESCDDGPVAGAMKSCLQTAQFGSYVFMTRELDISRVGALTDRGEFLDLRVLNDPLVNQLAGIFPNLPQQEGILAGREVLSRILEVGVAFQNTLGVQLYQGTGTANEFPGLDILIGTNKFDARTGTECPSLDSDIRDFADGNIATSAEAARIYTVMTSVARNLKNNARRMNFGATTWTITLREQLFDELSTILPCQMWAYGCIPDNANVSVNISADAQVALRDDMRQNRYLLIDGMRWPVVTDDSITETDLTGGVYSSDIYFIPRTVRGGFAVCYWEAFDYSLGTTRAIREGRLDGDFWTDAGRYLWHKKPPKNWCAQWIAKIEPRVILLTPHLAARIQNVAYQPDKHYRDVYPTDPFYVNGGDQERPVTPYFSDWNPPPPPV